jgi:hypothetical protein
MMIGSNIVRMLWSVLTNELRELRAQIDRLAVKFSQEDGPNAETTERAEELSVAMQRLERALLQQRLQRISVASAAVGGLQ